MANEADRSVVMALLQVFFLWKCDGQGLGPWGWPFSCLQILLQIVVRAVIGPVLLGCCRLQLTSLSSMIVLQAPLLGV